MRGTYNVKSTTHFPTKHSLFHINSNFCTVLTFSIPHISTTLSYVTHRCSVRITHLHSTCRMLKWESPKFIRAKMKTDVYFRQPRLFYDFLKNLPTRNFRTLHQVAMMSLVRLMTIQCPRWWVPCNFSCMYKKKGGGSFRTNHQTSVSLTF